MQGTGATLVKGGCTEVRRDEAEPVLPLAGSRRKRSGGGELGGDNGMAELLRLLRCCVATAERGGVGRGEARYDR